MRPKSMHAFPGARKAAKGDEREGGARTLGGDVVLTRGIVSGNARLREVDAADAGKIVSGTVPVLLGDA